MFEQNYFGNILTRKELLEFRDSNLLVSRKWFHGEISLTETGAKGNSGAQTRSLTFKADDDFVIGGGEGAEALMVDFDGITE